VRLIEKCDLLPGSDWRCECGEPLPRKGKRTTWNRNTIAAWEASWLCGYFTPFAAISSGRWHAIFWIVSKVTSGPGPLIEGDLGSTSGKWLSALFGFLLLSAVGAILGAIAWYTRPRDVSEE